MARRLLYVLGSSMPDEGPALMLLLEDDGSEVARYHHFRSFHRIQRYGEWWRLAGRDSETGELVYFREQAVA